MKYLYKNNRKKMAAITALTVLIALFTATSCDKLRNFNLDGFDISKIPILTDDYSLGSSGCSWKFSGLKTDSVYVINSDTELANFVLCTGSNTPPYIDFTQYTLLLAYGNANYFDFTKNYRKIAKNEYKLTVEVILDTVPVRQWHTALLVPKLPPSDTVVFELIEKRCEDTVGFTNYPIVGNFKVWGKVKNDSLYVINSSSEFYARFDSISTSIDFTKYTLLCARGWMACTPIIIDTVLSKNYCTNQYTLNVKIVSYQTMNGPWFLSILVPKINKTIIITDTKKYIYYTHDEIQFIF